MAKRKATFYPTIEGQIQPYYDNVADKLNGAIGTKYNTDAGVKAKLMANKAAIPVKINKAFLDNQTAQQSTAEKDSLLAEARIDAMLELDRIQRLPNWDENDAQGLGIRVVKAPIDLNTVKGKITHVTSLPDMNVIDWAKQGLEGNVIESIVQAAQPNGPVPVPPDQNSQDWKVIGTDFKSPYEDTRPNQTEFAETRYYRVRHLKNDKPVGLYSDIVKVVTDIHPV